MIEDELLKLRFKLGSAEALRGIYEKYLDMMLSVAMAFLNDAQAAEDIVHDVFVSLAQRADDFRLTGNLKHYLATCVTNRARDRLRAGQRHAVRNHARTSETIQSEPPEETLICAEQARRAYEALSQLSPEQREAVVLRIKAGMSLKQIAQRQNASYVAVQARYRRGIETLRSMLNGKHENEAP
jgi:RNA polymerase sigma factor (sigma-70 family)